MNRTPQLLLRTPPPYQDESLAGYILRLSESNYYQSPNWIIKLSGNRANRVIHLNQNSNKPSLLSQIIRISDERLNTMAYGAVVENQLFSYTIYRHVRQLCPQCLKDLSYSRQIWDNKMIKVCPFHQCLLLKKCPNCQKNIEWSRPGVSRCNCGCDFRHQLCEQADNYQLNLSLYLFGVEGNEVCQQQIEKIYGVDNPIFELTIEGFCFLSKFLNYSIFNYIASPTYRSIQTLIFPNIERKLRDYSQWELTLSLFQNWQEKFRHLLKWKEKQIRPLSFENVCWKYLLEFFCKLAMYFQVNSSFSQYMSDYIRRFLSRIGIKEIELRWLEFNQIFVISARLRNLDKLLAEVIKAFNLSSLDLAYLIFYCQDFALLFPDENFEKRNGIMLLRPPKPLFNYISR